MMGWFRMILYGFVAGLAEFLPISSRAHQRIASTVFDLGNTAPLRQFLIRIACLAALMISCRPELVRLRRERKLASAPARRRSRLSDSRSVATRRLLRTSSMLMIPGLFLYRKAQLIADNLAILAVVLLLNGILLLVPLYVRNGNKDARMLSRLDGILIGLSGALSAVPGISRIAAVYFSASLRGADKAYAIQFALLLSVPALIVLAVLDVIAVFSGIETMSFVIFLQYLLCMASAYLGCMLAISVVRNLATHTGFTGFAYYCWGMAMICLLLFLTT